MGNIAKLSTTIMALLFSALFSNLLGQVPLVYSAENRGASCPLPTLPEPTDLPSVIRLPNPFEFFDGSRVNTLDDWTCRRNEIKTSIEKYEVGIKPKKPADIVAAYAHNQLTVTVTENGETLTLTSAVTVPQGKGPFPVVIGVGFGASGGTGSLPADLFANCIKVVFNPAQVARDGQQRTGEFYRLYPNQPGAHYAAWSWGVSRLIDGLELVQTSLEADLTRIALTGCSRYGKLALFGGAFDERIALTIAQEPGGGGAAAWRVSETIGNVEKIDNTDYSWFLPSMRDNFKGRADRLPHDHHELIAMIAPRALLILGNDGMDWLADPSGYVSSMAAREVWKKFGVEDRMGFDFTGGHPHCAVSESQRDATDRFVKRFLYNNESVNTEVLITPYSDMNYQFWISNWAEVTEPSAPDVSFWYEPETTLCGTLGADFVLVDDSKASGGQYITAAEGLRSTNTTPNANGQLQISFDTFNHNSYYVYIRANCPDESSNSFWAKIDGDDFTLYDGLDTKGGWKWVPLIVDRPLPAGNHTLTIAYAEEGAMLDRILITNNIAEVPASGFGGPESECEPLKKYVKLDFENGHINDWTKQNPGAGISITQQDKHQGEYALKLVSGDGTAAWNLQAFTPDVEIHSGHTYTVTFWIRTEGGGGRGRISTTGAGSLGAIYWADFTVGNEWQKIEYTNLIANSPSIKLAFDLGYVPNKTYYIDDILFNDLDIEESVEVNSEKLNVN